MANAPQGRARGYGIGPPASRCVCTPSDGWECPQDGARRECPESGGKLATARAPRQTSLSGLRLLGSSSDVLWVTGRGAAAFEPIKHGLIVAAARCGDVQRLGFWAIDLAPLAAPALAEEISVA